MNDVIKEIIEENKRIIKNSDYENHYHLCDYFEIEHIAKLLDYITNLQQDNTMYAQLKDEYEEEIKDLQQENERLKEQNETNIDRNVEAYKIVENLQSRIDKAVNQLKIIMQIIKEQPTRNIEDDE